MPTPLTSSNATLWASVALLLGAVGCHQTHDGLDKRWLMEPDATTVDFGTVTLPETSSVQAFTLRNTGRKALALGALSPAALGVDAPTFQLMPQASSCESGAVLDVGQSCTLAFTFTPSQNTAYSDTIEVSWRSLREQAHKEETFSRTLLLRGEGDVDCTADPTWAQAYSEGKGKALDANTKDFERGYASGQAKDYGDGYRRGYDGAYAPAYDSAYKHAYDRAYGTFYDEGYDEGWYVYADTWQACQAGDADGWADGSAWGDEEGAVAGIDAGLYDGAADGDGEAWDLLISAEDWGGVFAACDEAYVYFYGANAQPASEPPPSAGGDAIAGMCEDEGFAAHRDLSSHDEGYAKGLRDNDEYQSGLREGGSEGTSEGTIDGNRGGTRDGRQDGFDDGAVEGKADAEQLAYDDCYDAAYPAAYGEAYDIAYVDSYWLAYDEAFAAAYDDAMNAYYVDADCETVLFGS